MRSGARIAALAAFGASAALSGCAGMSVGDSASAVTSGTFNAFADAAITIGRAGIFDALGDAAIMLGRGGAHVVNAVLDTVPFPAHAGAPAPIRAPVPAVPAPALD